MTQAIFFPESAPYLTDTCLACSTSSENAWSYRYSCPSHPLRGGNNANNSPNNDISRLFMVSLLRNLVSKYDQDRKERIKSCLNELRIMTTNRFVYNKTPGDEGIDLICRHISDLRDAFPKMDLSVTHFHEPEKKSSVTILIAKGIMKGPWLNRPATDKYEYLSLVFHILSNKEKNKIEEVHFRSEFLSEETYRKIKALDLIHTAFAINTSAKEIAKITNQNSSGSEKGNTKNVLPSVTVPLLLAASMDSQKNLSKEFEKELAEVEKNYLGKVPSSPSDPVLTVTVENYIKNVNQNESNGNTSEKKDSVKKNNSNKPDISNSSLTLNEENILNKIKNLGSNQLRSLAKKAENKKNNDTALAELYDDIFDNKNNNNNNNNNTITNTNTNTNTNTKTDIVNVNKDTNDTNNINNNEENAEENNNVEDDDALQDGGEGYYVAVEEIPIAGMPVIRGYEKCCPPYFATGGDHEKMLPNSSLTLSQMKDGVVQSISNSITNQTGKNISEAMGFKGSMAKHIEKNVEKQMAPNAKKVIQENLDKGVHHLENYVHHDKNNNHHNQQHRLVATNGKNMKKGGNLLGTLGTIILPMGSSVKNAVPWLLTLGALFGNRLESDIFSLLEYKNLKKISQSRKSKSQSRKSKSQSRKSKSQSRKSKSQSRKSKSQTKKSKSKSKSGRSKSKSKSGRSKSKSKSGRSKSKSKSGRSKSKSGRSKSKSKVKKAVSLKPKKWTPLTNSDIRKIMKQSGGFCANGICGDPSLAQFNGCKRPEWGVITKGR
jgi:hypothetical protein